MHEEIVSRRNNESVPSKHKTGKDKCSEIHDSAISEPMTRGGLKRSILSKTSTHHFDHGPAGFFQWWAAYVVKRDPQQSAVKHAFVFSTKQRSNSGKIGGSQRRFRKFYIEDIRFGTVVVQLPILIRLPIPNFDPGVPFILFDELADLLICHCSHCYRSRPQP